jgi:hypothetical protein
MTYHRNEHPFIHTSIPYPGSMLEKEILYLYMDLLTLIIDWRDGLFIPLRIFRLYLYNYPFRLGFWKGDFVFRYQCLSLG